MNTTGSDRQARWAFEAVFAPGTDAGRLEHVFSGGTVVVVRPSVLRQVIRTHAQWIAIDPPHPHSLVLPRAALERIVLQHGLLLETEGLDDPVVLVAEPGPAERSALPPWVVQRRLLAGAYHALVHARLERLVRRGELGAQRAQQLLGRFGHPQAREALRVLAHADELLPPPGPTRDLIELLARSLELRHAAAPWRLEAWFPSLQPGDLERVCAALRTDGIALDPEAVLGPEASGWLADLAPRPREETDSVRSETRTDAEPPPAAAHLAYRLWHALGEHGPRPERWAAALAPLIGAREEGTLARRGRKLLADLDRACLDAEQPATAIDLTGWLRSFGRRPLRRALHDQVPVRVHRRLRTALGRARRLRTERSDLEPLVAVLEGATQHAETAIRERFTPGLRAALRAVGLDPHTVVEELAADKTADELVDRLLERDYVSFADLRDELSRNDLKLEDVESPLQLLTGDALLRADRLLGRRYPGVYRRSTFYMRFLQRTSSLFFGTRLGRWLVRFLLLPFVISIMTLEGLQHLLEPIGRATGLGTPHLVHRGSVLALAAFTLGLLEYPPLRRLVAGLALRVGRGLRLVLWALPLRLLRLPWLRRLLDTALFAVIRRAVVRPAAVVGLVWLLLRAYGLDVYLGWREWAAIFIASSAAINTRFGLQLQAHLRDTFAAWWGQITRRLLPELVRATLDLSRRALGAFERAAHLVDELLRVRREEGRAVVAFKIVAGRVWAVLAYVLQFLVTLFIEPQINPIKHFPVVTVSHKLLLPSLPLFVSLFEAVFEPALAKTLATATVFTLPGFFGFLVWELNANWRLYAASRSDRLEPALVGRHGERMPALLRPGFHSGTVPKAWERLRQRADEAWQQGELLHAWRERLRLQEVTEDVARFWQRECCRLLAGRSELGPAPWEVRGVRLGRYRAGVELGPPAQEPLLLWLEVRDRWLTASIERAGCAAALGAAGRATLADALFGALVRAQLEAWCPWEEPEQPLAIEEHDDSLEREVRDVVQVDRTPPGIDLRAPRLRWSDWVARWERGQAPRVAPAFPDAEPIARALRAPTG